MLCYLWILAVAAAVLLAGCGTPQQRIEQARARCLSHNFEQEARANLAGLSVRGSSANEARLNALMEVLKEQESLRHDCYVKADPVGQARLDAEEKAKEAEREAEREAEAAQKRAALSAKMDAYSDCLKRTEFKDWEQWCSPLVRR